MVDPKNIAHLSRFHVTELTERDWDMIGTKSAYLKVPLIAPTLFRDKLPDRLEEWIRDMRREAREYYEMPYADELQERRYLRGFLQDQHVLVSRCSMEIMDMAGMGPKDKRVRWR